MKGLKVAGIILGCLVAIALCLVALAFAPPVQTWAARRAIAKIPGASIQIGRVSAGMSGARITELRYSKDGVVVAVPEILVRGSPVAYLRNNGIDVDDVTAREIVVDLRQAIPGSKPAPPAPAAFAGALKLAQLPADIRIGKLMAGGRVLLQGGRTVAFTLDGSDVKTGSEGQVAVKVDLTDATPGAALTAAHADLRGKVRIATDRRVDALSFEANLSLDGPRLPPERFQLVFKANQAAAGADETYELDFGVSRAAGLDRILTARGTYRNSTADFVGDWNAAIRTEQLASVLAGLGFPSVALNGSGKVQFAPEKRVGSASGQIEADISRLETLNPALAVLQGARLRTDFDVGMEGKLVRLERAQFEIASGDGRRLADISALQKIAYDTGAKKLAAFDVNSDLATIVVRQLPLAWIQTFLPGGAKLEAGDVSASVAVQATPDGAVTLRTTSPVLVKGAAFALDEKPFLRGIDVSADVALTRTPDGVATLKVPLVVTVGTRRSDLTVEGTIKPAGAVKNFSGKISGEQVVLDDLLGLAAIARSPSAPADGPARSTARPAAPGANPAVAPDAAPFWKDFAGTVTTDLKQVRYGSYAITGVRGNAVATATKLSLEGFEGRYGTDPYSLSGAVTFTAGKPQPYSLLGAAKVSNLDLGAILRAVNPNEPPAIESRITLDANLTGTGRTSGELFQNVRGRFDLTGGAGVMRALAKRGQRTAIGVISALAGIYGRSQGSDTATAIAELTSFFNDAPFEKFTLSAERAEDLGVRITAIEVISPSYRLTGNGTVAHQNDGPLTTQPLSLQFRLATKDNMAFLFDRVGLLKPEMDDQGYTYLNRDFTLRGTPAQPDPGDFWGFITDAAIRGAAASGLLGR